MKPVRLYLYALLACVTWAATPTSADVADLQRAVASLAAQHQAVAHAADLAAERYVRQPRLAVRGSQAISIDLATRPGGFASYHGVQNAPGGVVLYHLDYPARKGVDAKARLLEHLRDAIALRKAGHVVIGFVSRRTIERQGGEKALAHACDAVVDVPDDGPATFGHLAAAWAFQAELFAACTRLGRTPVLRVSPRLDRKRWRQERYQGLDFHSIDTVEPIAAGELTRRYLHQLGELIRDMASINRVAIRKAADRIRTANRTGGTAWLAAAPSPLSTHAAGLSHSDPDLLRWWGTQAGAAGVGPRDVFIAFGTDHAPGEPWWPLAQIDAMQAAGLGTVYVLDTCYLDPARDTPRGDVLIKTWQPWEDALVKISNHPARVGASSGLLTEAIYYLVTAQASQDVEEAD